jgi:hypothetical protein
MLGITEVIEEGSDHGNAENKVVGHGLLCRYSIKL